MNINKLKSHIYCFLTKLLKIDIIHLKTPGNSKKYVLLSYITHPFRIPTTSPRFSQHSNLWECKEIANIWLKYGYNVDVIDYNNNRFIPNHPYDIFIDIHSNMERLSPYLHKSKKILHITGAHWEFQNNAEIKRIEGVKNRKGVILMPVRQVLPSTGIEHADCGTILGNKFTQDTFEYAKKPLFPIPLSTIVQYPFYDKDYDKIRNNYLWLGSSGMVHKGLDLVLEAFSQLPEYNLIICGPVNKEKDFEKAYYDELYNLPNVKVVGFIDITSSKFVEIITNTIGLIYPSCSEGQAGSVITCMHAGLIPIISYESGVNTGDFGYTLSENTIEVIIKTIITLSQKSTDELQKMSFNSWSYARENHTRESFSKKYEEFVNWLITMSDHNIISEKYKKNL